MIAVMMLTFMLFFAFVVNTGMLVNAKINLQNAADLAAYSGASAQARQLNTIAFLNYEMRRQYKKFLFRYYVMGNMYQDSFPVNGSPGSLPIWSPGLPKTANYGVPSVCIVYNTNDNFCHLAAQRSIAFPPRNLLDQITQTLISQYREIERIRQNNCLSIGRTNLQLLTLWLFNTDPSFAALKAAGPTAVDTRTVQILEALASGLGLLPREIILRSRIDTMLKYLNSAPRQGLSFEEANGLKTASAPGMERSVNAFFSAYNTLGNHTFEDPASIVMDELMPESTPGSPLIAAVKDIKTTFDTYAIDFEPRAPLANPNAPTGVNDCAAVLRPVTIRNPIPLGVYKDPKILTYYAIRLRAKAKILFSPFGDMELKAYAAAQPFGSRLGPPLTAEDFTQALQPPTQFLPRNNAQPLLGRIPNLPFGEEAPGAGSYGWNNPVALGKLYQKFKPPGSSSSLGTIGADEMERAYQSVMVPNPFEGSRYSIMSDTVTDGGAIPLTSMVNYFDQNFRALVWAPIAESGAPPEVKDKLQTVLTEVFGAGAGTNGDLAKLLPALQQGLAVYVDDLNRGAGEGIDQGIRIARFTDPFRARAEVGIPPKVIDLDPSLMIRSLAQVRTSWPSKVEGIGRIGYSVKYVSFQSLTDKKLPSDGTETWTNELNLDSEAQADLPFVKH